MAEAGNVKPDGAAAPDGGKGKSKRRATKRVTKTSTKTSTKAGAKSPDAVGATAGSARPGAKSETKRTSAKKGGTRRVTPKGGARSSGSQRRTKVAEVTVSHEAIVRRVKEARGTALVVLAARAIGGALITVLIAGGVVWLLAFVLLPLKWSFLFVVASLAAAAGMAFAAHVTSVKSVPEVASGLAFLHDRAFVWVDPFREDRPHLLPFWLEAVLWAPTQVLAGAVPFLRVKKIHEADAEAAAGLARRMVEDREVRVTGDLSSDSAEAGGLRLLLLLRLARLAIEDDEIVARVSGLGQTALFEGSVG